MSPWRVDSCLFASLICYRLPLACLSVFFFFSTMSSQMLSSITPGHTSGSQKTSTTGSSSDVTGSVTKRLSNELMTLMMSSSPGISAFPRSDDNLYEWVGTIEGAAETVYAGLTYRISISFPSSYPYVPPNIKFETPCYHPNVDVNTGAICLDILQDKWSAVYSVQTILLSLQSLLGEPNNASPLNPDAAKIWKNQEQFKAELLKVYRAPN